MEQKGILKVGFMGCGNFGGQAANAVVEEGFDAIAVNASKNDFATLSDKVVQFLVGDGKGTGKSRETAVEFIASHINLVKDDVIVKFIESNDVIVVGGSAGGGFGSGAVPTLTEILMQIYPSKCFRIVTTMPSMSEMYEAHKHTEEFMKEVIDLQVPYIVYDNDNFNNIEASEMNKQIISNLVRDMKILRGDYILETTTGGIDERDLLTVNSTPGRTVCCVIEDLEESMVEDGGIVAAIKKSIAASPNPTLVDDKVIAATAVMYNLNTDLKKYGSNITADIQSNFGMYLADFRNEAVDNPETKPFVACILAGLTTPTTRIDKAISRRVQIEKEYTSRIAASTKLGTIERGTLSLKTKSFGSSTDKPNVDEILKKFSNK